MPITVTEKPESRPSADGDSPSTERKYLIEGTDDEQEALDALAAESPAICADLVRQAWDVDPVGDGSRFWEGVVRYGPYSAAPKEVGESTFQFDTGGGSMHITQAKEHVQDYFFEGDAAPDFQGAIGVTRDSVEGCDVITPVYNWSETHYLAAETVDGAYKAALFALTGRTNDEPFRGFADGEVLFLGASGSQRGDESWEITFRFASLPNATDLVIGELTGIEKRGWEYLWVRYEDVDDEDAKCIVKRPRSVHIERVYDAGDFADLGIGTE